jgi:hypothetical protein
MKLIIHGEDTCPSCDSPMATTYWFKNGMTATALHANGPDKWAEWAIKIVAECHAKVCGYVLNKK